MTVEQLARAVKAVRHRGIQRRINRFQPDVPMRVTPTGMDWRPCEVCREEAALILAELNR